MDDTPITLIHHDIADRRLVREQPEITLKQMRARLLKQGIDASKSSIARFFDHLDPEEAAGPRVWPQLRVPPPSKKVAR